MKKLFVVLMVIIVLVMLPTVALAADGTEGDIDFWSYIVDETLVLIPVLYIIGVLIKKIPNIPDWIIPIVLTVIAVLAAMAITGWDINGVIQGILVAGVTVLTNQVYKQTAVKRIE